MSKILARVIGGGGSAGTATSNDVLSGKTFSNDDDVDIVGTATEYPITEHHVTTADQIIIPANSHTTGNQVLKGIVTGNLTPSTIRSGKTVTINNGEKNIVSINGTYTSSISNGQQPVTADKIVSGYSGFVNGSNEIQGTAPDKSGLTSTASALDMNGSDIRMKIPTSGFYSTASYIKSSSLNFGDASAADVASGKTFTSSSGLKIEGTATNRSGGNIYGSLNDQIVIPAHTHVSGDIILKALEVYGLTPENICSGKTVNIWNGAKNILSVSGSTNTLKMAYGDVGNYGRDIKGYIRPQYNFDSDALYGYYISPGFDVTFAIYIGYYYPLNNAGGFNRFSVCIGSYDNMAVTVHGSTPSRAICNLNHLPHYANQTLVFTHNAASNNENNRIAYFVFGH